MVLSITIAKEVDSGKDVKLNIDYAIEERIQILGNSGSGKSHLARCICEKANGKIQQIIISPKKEFVTLREKFDYIHVGTKSEISKPDIELNTRYAGQLALKILESGMDAVIEFSESPKDRIKFVKNFLEDGLMLAPEHLWHPVMILIDEIDVWAPEKGHGEAESLAAIVDLAARGRDKGYFLVAATQKLAKFNKDVASELNIKFIGKVSLDNDQTRAAQELGIPTKEKGKLRFLGRPLFHFYAFGPGLSDDVIKIKSLPVQTTHVSGYKRNKLKKIIATPAAVKSVIARFSDLPKEAEKEIKTKEDMKKKINELTHELRKAKNQSKDISPIDLKAAHEAGHKKAYDEFLRTNNKLKREHNEKILKIVNDIKVALKFNSMVKQNMMVVDKITETLSHAHAAIEGTKITEIPVPKMAYAPIEIKTVKPTPKGFVANEPIFLGNPVKLEEPLSLSEKNVLTAIAQLGEPTKEQIAIISQYSVTSGGFAKALSDLKKKHFITVQNGKHAITESGSTALGTYDPLPTDHESLLKTWTDKLGTAPGKILEILSHYQDTGLSKEELSEQSGYSMTSGGFAGAIATLKKMKLITVEGRQHIISNTMFPEILA